MRKPYWMPDDVEPQQLIDRYSDGVAATAIIQEFNLDCQYGCLLKYLRTQGVSIRSKGQGGSHSKECLGCGKVFISRYSETPICLECAPDKSWRQRFEFYGITKLKFDELWEKQSGLCDLCELPLPATPSDIKIDHCHKQNFVRALLHHKCNVGLHYVEDDKFLAQAIRYIERHRR
jgi:hypothetical protein